MNITEDIKHKIIYIIRAVLPETNIYLYGSHAKGYASENSDIDIALDNGSKIDKFKFSEIRNLLEHSYITCKFDVVDLYAIKEDFKEKIMKDSISWQSQEKKLLLI